MLLNQLFILLHLNDHWFFDNKLFKSILVLFFVLLLAFFIRYLYQKFIKNIKSNLSNKLLNSLNKPIFYSVILLGFTAVLSTAGINEDSILSRAITSIFWIMWGVFLIKISKMTLHYMALNFTKQKVVRPQSLPLFVNLSLILICIIFFYLILAIWGVDVNALIASAGILGLGIGFAAKDTLANLFSGIFILIDQPYRMGDFVVLDSGERGEVTHIGIRSTRILTRDDIEVTVPNAIMGNTKIINESGGPYKKYRIRVPVGVAYGEAVDNIRNILLTIANSNSMVCKIPEPKVRFRTFGDSNLNLELLCWIDDPVLRGVVLDALNEDIYTSFLKQNIEIPYQKQDIYIKEFLQD